MQTADPAWAPAAVLNTQFCSAWVGKLGSAAPLVGIACMMCMSDDPSIRVTTQKVDEKSLAQTQGRHLKIPEG